MGEAVSVPAWVLVMVVELALGAMALAVMWGVFRQKILSLEEKVAKHAESIDLVARLDERLKAVSDDMHAVRTLVESLIGAGRVAAMASRRT